MRLFAKPPCTSVVVAAAASEARTAAEEASVLAAAARAAADERAAELRVAQDSLRAMREECNERWVSNRLLCCCSCA
jgi:hypothetical protein